MNTRKICKAALEEQPRPAKCMGLTTTRCPQLCSASSWTSQRAPGPHHSDAAVLLLFCLMQSIVSVSADSKTWSPFLQLLVSTPASISAVWPYSSLFRTVATCCNMLQQLPKYTKIRSNSPQSLLVDHLDQIYRGGSALHMCMAAHDNYFGCEASAAETYQPTPYAGQIECLCLDTPPLLQREKMKSWRIRTIKRGTRQMIVEIQQHGVWWQIYIKCMSAACPVGQCSGGITLSHVSVFQQIGTGTSQFRLSAAF